MVSKTPPSWFKALSDLGCEMASQPNRTVGERFPIVVLSVPTGQFATWAISNGALSSIPKIVQPESFPLDTLESGGFKMFIPKICK